MDIKAISIDDDPMSQMLVRGFCKRFEHIKLEYTYTDPFKGAAGIVTKKPDLVFLDVEMPGFTGLQIMKSLSRLPKVVVMSTDASFESQAMELNASAFIQKPATLEKFSQVIDKITKELKQLKGKTQTKSL